MLHCMINNHGAELEPMAVPPLVKEPGQDHFAEFPSVVAG